MSVPPPPYAVLGGQGSLHQQPTHRRTIPRYDSNYNRESGGGTCFRCMFCCCCCLLLLVIVFTGTLLYLFLTLEPKLPAYRIESFEVKEFRVIDDSTIKTVILVSVEAQNQNKRIVIVYGHDSSVTVSYKERILCHGSLPSFMQSYETKTMMNIELKGMSRFNSDLQEELTESTNSGRITLLVVIKAPVQILAHNLFSRRLVVHVICTLVVDQLAPNKKIKIISSTYSVRGSL